MALTFRQATLDNGLTIIAETNPDAHSAGVGFFVRTGARDEAAHLMGVSHFLEHMMFKGYEGVGPDELNRAFDDIGARNNAYTSSDLTCFYAHALPERLDRTTELVARMLRPALRPAEFDTEKSVILEEIAMYKDSPFWVLYEQATERHFREHPVGHRVLGTDETVTALSRDAMQEYFNRRYSADNTVVAFAGRVDFHRAVEQIRELCGGWSATAPDREPAPPAVGAGEFTLRQKNVNRAYLIGLAAAPPIEDDRRYAAMLLARALGGPDNSRLHWALVEPGLAEEAACDYSPHEGYGQFFIYVSGDPERAGEIWARAMEEAQSIADTVEENDLARLRALAATAVTLNGENPQDQMQRIGAQWTLMRRHTTLEEELERIRSVTLDDLREVARAFPVRPVTEGRLLPMELPME
jgi:predicted Zn-dependent peptidase